MGYTLKICVHRYQRDRTLAGKKWVNTKRELLRRHDTHREKNESFFSSARARQSLVEVRFPSLYLSIALNPQVVNDTRSCSRGSLQCQMSCDRPVIAPHLV